MARLNSGNLFLILLLSTLMMSGYFAYSFLGQVNDNSILVRVGAEPTRQIYDSYAYGMGMKGLVFSGTCFAVGIFFFLMVVVPSEQQVAKQKTREVPEPLSTDDSTIAKVANEEAERIASDTGGSLGSSTPLSPSGPKLDKSVGIMPSLTEDEYIEGEDDVVYGTGWITDQAIIDFVNKYVDSALKFLYRKELDGKPVKSADEEIYQRWEGRGLSREKVREYILTVMDWREMPNEPLTNIWKNVRDRIFDLTH